MAQKKGLGKGLNAFFGSDESLAVNTQEIKNTGIIEIDINKIEPNREQPRKYFDEALLDELAKSIEEFGIIQPLIVKKENDYYSIVAGERRWRAARIAKVKKVPVIIKDYSALEIIEVALIENIQRSDLNPIEEAMCYKRLIDEYEMTQEQISQKVGKSRSTITNSLRLLGLDNRVQNFLVENKLSIGHAKCLLSLDDFNLQFELAEKIIEESLSVREIEMIIKELNNKEEDIPKNKPKQNKNTYKHIEKDLNTILGTKVNIKDGKNKGKIEIEYYNDDELDRILMMFKKLV